MKLFLIVLGVAVLVVLVGAGCAAVRGGYASAPYKVVRMDGKFEVREYPALAVVETPMNGNDNSFMRLFHYIDRQNTSQEKISMTTPVLMAGGTNGMMAFVLPANVSASGAPKPTDEQVHVKEVAAGQFAVLRFSGGINANNETNALARLETWLRQAALTPTGSAIYGYFDPPWTPAFLRRNEVMLRLVQ